MIQSVMNTALPEGLVNPAALKEAWVRFVDSGSIDPGIDPVVARSWQRCAARLGALDSPQWAHMPESKRSRASIQQNFLRLIGRPVMEDVYQFMERCGSLLVLADSSACVFELLGDPEMEKYARDIGLDIGVFLDENRIGTTAFSCALMESFPTQVVGPEHYLRAFHGLYSAAAPVHDPTGNLIGTIGIVRRQLELTSPYLGIVVAASKAIENQLQTEQYIREANVQMTEFDATLDAVSEGIIAWSAGGTVTHLNGRGGRLLGINPTMVVGRPLGDYISVSENIAEAVNRGEELNDAEAALHVHGEKHEVSLSLRVIRGRHGAPEVFIATLRPMAQVHQLVNRMVGTRARLTLEDIVGTAPSTADIRSQAKNAVESDVCVLLTGESGSGKNSLARAIHNSGPRSSKPFLAFHCGRVPRELTLDELLGHEPGSPDNPAGQPSKFELAYGGTLYVEDVDALPLDAQELLLEVIEKGEVVRIGGTRSIPLDVRIIASTETDLDQRVATRTFLAELNSRLSGISVWVPPLRERSEDIPFIVDRILSRFQSRRDHLLTISKEALEWLKRRQWPGNIAELEFAVEFAIHSATGSVIGISDFPESYHVHSAEYSVVENATSVTTIREAEKAAIENALRVTSGNFRKSAAILGISRSTLYRKVHDLDIR